MARKRKRRRRSSAHGLDHPIYGRILHSVRAWDFASSEKKEADFTASTLMVSTTKSYRFVLEVTEDKVSPGKRDALVRAKAIQDGRSTRIICEQEPGSQSEDTKIHYLKLLPEFDVQFRRPASDKVSRASNLVSWWENGLIKVVRANWNSKYFDQLRAFPKGDHDDMVDSTSSAFNELAGFNSGGTSGTLIAGGPNLKQLTPEDVDAMSDGPLKNILQHFNGMKRR